MNIASAELLQNALQNLGNTFQKSRAQDAEEEWRQSQTDTANRRTDVDQAFRNAQMAHYNQMETDASRRADAQEQRADAQSDQASAAQDQQALAGKQGMLKSAMGLNATGQLTDDSRTQVNKWLATDPHFSVTGMQLQAPPNPATNPTLKQSALVQAVGTIKNYRDMASQTEDPDEADSYGHLADLLEKNLPQAVKSTTPPPVVKPTSTKTIDYNPAGKPVKAVTSYGMPGADGSAAPSNAAPATAAATPSPSTARVQMAERLAVQYPDWSKERIIAEVKNSFAP
jgi:hypothetical protein